MSLRRVAAPSSASRVAGADGPLACSSFSRDRLGGIDGRASGRRHSPRAIESDSARHAPTSSPAPTPRHRCRRLSQPTARARLARCAPTSVMRRRVGQNHRGSSAVMTQQGARPICARSSRRGVPHRLVFDLHPTRSAIRSSTYRYRSGPTESGAIVQDALGDSSAGRAPASAARRCRRGGWPPRPVPAPSRSARRTPYSRRRRRARRLRRDDTGRSGRSRAALPPQTRQAKSPPLVVANDPCHGRRDPALAGDGLHEKDVVLAIGDPAARCSTPTDHARDADRDADFSAGTSAQEGAPVRPTSSLDPATRS